MSIRRLEQLLNPVTEAEFEHNIERRQQLAQYILEGNHPQYPVHQLIDAVTLGTSDILFYIGYYVGKGQNLVPVVFNDQAAPFDHLEVFFKITHIPSFPKYDLKLGYSDREKRHEILNTLHGRQSPYALLALNASPGNLFFTQFSHHAEFSVSEALSEVQDNARQQLAYATSSNLANPNWQDILL